MQDHNLNIYACASHVEAAIADKTYKLVLEIEEGPQEGEVNALIADQVPSSLRV